jgi:hypothetical protein
MMLESVPLCRLSPKRLNSCANAGGGMAESAATRRPAARAARREQLTIQGILPGSLGKKTQLENLGAEYELSRLYKVTRTDSMVH